MKKGFTLIELLISLSMIATISAVITSVYLVGFKTFNEEVTASNIQSSSQTILDSLITDTRNGILIEQSYLSYTTGPNSIIIREPAIDANDNIIYSGTNMLFDRIIYYYQDSAIHKIILANPASARNSRSGFDTILDKNILVLNFTYNPDQTTATLVTATITSTIQEGSRKQSITVTGQARLRNHI